MPCRLSSSTAPACACAWNWSSSTGALGAEHQRPGGCEQPRHRRCARNQRAVAQRRTRGAGAFDQLGRAIHQYSSFSAVESEGRSRLASQQYDPLPARCRRIFGRPISTTSISRPRFINELHRQPDGHRQHHPTGVERQSRPDAGEGRAHADLEPVLTPSFIENLDVSVDYYKTKMTDAITQIGYAGVQGLCLASAPNYDSPYCTLAIRPITNPADAGYKTAANFPSEIRNAPLNVARQELHGYDFQLNYGWEYGWSLVVPAPRELSAAQRDPQHPRLSRRFPNLGARAEAQAKYLPVVWQGGLGRVVAEPVAESRETGDQRQCPQQQQPELQRAVSEGSTTSWTPPTSVSRRGERTTRCSWPSTTFATHAPLFPSDSGLPGFESHASVLRRHGALLHARHQGEFLTPREIPADEIADYEGFLRRVAEPCHPAVIRGLVRDWPVVRNAASSCPLRRLCGAIRLGQAGRSVRRSADRRQVLLQRGADRFQFRQAANAVRCGAQPDHRRYRARRTQPRQHRKLFERCSHGVRELQVARP